VPARWFVRRFERRASRIAALAQSEFRDAVGSHATRDHDAAPWWVDAAANALRSDIVDWLLLSGPGAAEKGIGFLFADRDAYPVAVVKIASSSHAIGRVERGYRALVQLRDAGATARGLAPEPLALLAGPVGQVASVETATRGTWLDSLLRRGNEAQYAERITEWLVDLGSATRGADRDDAWPALLRDVVERFCENVAGLVDPGFLGAACAAVADVERLPTVFEHHDCAPWNIYASSERLVAFDWDNADPRGIPAFDLVQGLGYLAMSIDGSLGTLRFAESFRRREAGPLRLVWRECRSRYASALGIDEDALRAIRVFAWMRLTNDETESRRRARNPLQGDAIERSMLGLWLEEARSAIDR
jgi:hypothetical protein